MILKQSTVFTRLFSMKSSTDGRTPKTGAAPVVNLSKAGAAFGAAAGAVSEIANGFYKVVLTTVDTNTAGDLGFYITGTAADPTSFVDQVETRVVADLLIDAFGNVSIASSLKKNQALAGFTFLMTDATTHGPKTGLTVTAQRSLAGAGFANCVNAVSELSNGMYVITLAASDLNASCIMLKFTASGADDLDIFLITQP
jgi:hypothetical protein